MGPFGVDVSEKDGSLRQHWLQTPSNPDGTLHDFPLRAFRE